MPSAQPTPSHADWQRPPAEVLYAHELAALRKSDTAPKPPGWGLSLQAVKRFILGDKAASPRSCVRPPSLNGPW